MSQTQVTAAIALLKKIMPDIHYSEQDHKAELTVTIKNYVLDGPQLVQAKPQASIGGSNNTRSPVIQ